MRAECQATTECRREQQSTRLHAAFFQCLAQCDGNGCCRHVAVLADSHHHALHRHAGALGDGLDDALVGLVRDDEVDVVRGLSRPLEHVLAGDAHARDGLLEDFLSLELPRGGAHERVGVRVGGAHAVDAQDLARVTIAAELLEQDALLVVGRLHDHGGDAVAKQHGDVAVVPVHEGRDALAAHDEDRLHDAGADHRGGGREAVKEARAGRVDVHRAAAVGADALLQARGLVRALVVMRGRAEDDEVEILCRHAGAGHGAARRDLGHVAERDFGDAALADAGARGDPLVRRIQEGRDVGVCQYAGRQALAPARNARIRHANSPLKSAFWQPFEAAEDTPAPKGLQPVAGLSLIRPADFAAMQRGAQPGQRKGGNGQCQRIPCGAQIHVPRGNGSGRCQRRADEAEKKRVVLRVGGRESRREPAAEYGEHGAIGQCDRIQRGVMHSLPGRRKHAGCMHHLVRPRVRCHDCQEPGCDCKYAPEDVHWTLPACFRSRTLSGQ